MLRLWFRMSPLEKIAIDANIPQFQWLRCWLLKRTPIPAKAWRFRPWKEPQKKLAQPRQNVCWNNWNLLQWYSSILGKECNYLFSHIFTILRGTCAFSWDSAGISRFMMNDIIIEQLIAQPTWLSFLRPAEQWRLPECCNILHSKQSYSSMVTRYSWGIFRNIDVAIFLNCSQAAYISRSSVWHPRNGCNTWSPMVARMSWGRKAG